MRYIASAALLLSLTLLPTACLWQQQQQRQGAAARSTAEAQPRVLAPLHLGAVHQVYPEQGFALLRIIGPMPAPGTTLITHPANGSNERIGNLSIPAQNTSRNGIVAADIRSGTVVKGDRVFRYRNVAAQEDSGDIIAAERPAGLAPEQAEYTPETAPIPPPAPQQAEPEPDMADINDSESDVITEITPAAVETTVLPTHVPAAQGSDPGAPAAPSRAPGYLDSIPDNIDEWN